MASKTKVHLRLGIISFFSSIRLRTLWVAYSPVGCAIGVGPSLPQTCRTGTHSLANKLPIESPSLAVVFPWGASHGSDCWNSLYLIMTYMKMPVCIRFFHRSILQGNESPVYLLYKYRRDHPYLVQQNNLFVTLAPKSFRFNTGKCRTDQLYCANQFSLTVFWFSSGSNCMLRAVLWVLHRLPFTLKVLTQINLNIL